MNVRRWGVVCAVIAGVAVTGAGADVPAGDEVPEDVGALCDRVKGHLRPLASLDGALSGDEAAFCRWYGLPVDGVERRFGYVESRGYRLAVHVLVPRKTRGTVILLHGYHDHSGLLARAAVRLLDEGYAVLLYDMPGHGLSSGERCSIGDFAEYGLIAGDLAAYCRRELPGPVHLVAHSTGGAAVIEYLQTTRDPGVDKVVLVAPLVRSWGWALSVPGCRLVEPFTSKVPRVFRRSTADEGFLRFTREYDPLLNGQYLPLRWFKALEEWNERLSQRSPCPKPLLVLQGPRDTVVDWRYNMAYLRRNFPASRVCIVRKGHHQLLNEAEPVRTEVFVEMLRYLEEER